MLNALALETVKDFLSMLAQKLLGMKPCLYLVEINIFYRQNYQNYEQLSQTSKDSDFQNHFSVSKIGQIFPRKIFL